MDYIEETLGLPVIPNHEFNSKSLPLYLTEHYQMTSAKIGEIPVVFITPRTDLEQTQVIKKHIHRIEQNTCANTVLVLKSVSYYRRKTLIEARIPFVIPNKQLFLPFLGTHIQNQPYSEYTPIESMQPSAQALLLFYIYDKRNQLYISEAVKKLEYSAMTISRAVRQLVDLGLMEEYKNGVQKIIHAKCCGKDLFEQALPYCATPVKREIYVSIDTLSCANLLSGTSALAEHSMLNPEFPVCYGTYYKEKLSGSNHLVDSKQQCRVQLWKYNPELFRKWTSRNTVDPLSLFLSLKDHPDERIEEALEEYIDNFWEEYNGHWY